MSKIIFITGASRGFGKLWAEGLLQQGHKLVVTVPVLGLYNASKFAIEGLSETLAEEVKRFGINLTLVEPNQFATDWAGASATQTETMPEYDGVRADFFARLTDESIGLPEATTPAILKLIESNNPPFRLLLGNFGLPWVSQVYKNRENEWNDWKEVSFAAQGK